MPQSRFNGRGILLRQGSEVLAAGPGRLGGKHHRGVSVLEKMGSQHRGPRFKWLVTDQPHLETPRLACLAEIEDETAEIEDETSHNPWSIGDENDHPGY